MNKNLNKIRVCVCVCVCGTLNSFVGAAKKQPGHKTENGDIRSDPVKIFKKHIKDFTGEEILAIANDIEYHREMKNVNPLRRLGRNWKEGVILDEEGFLDCGGVGPATLECFKRRQVLFTHDSINSFRSPSVDTPNSNKEVEAGLGLETISQSASGSSDSIDSPSVSGASLRQSSSDSIDSPAVSPRESRRPSSSSDRPPTPLERAKKGVDR